MNREQPEYADHIDIKAFIKRLTAAWPLFLICMMCCVFSALLYLRYTSPLYRTKAAIMVKDEKKGVEMFDNSMMKEIGLGGNTKLVENEIEIFKSYDLIDSVVSKLQLYTSVRKVGRVRDIELFGDELPFIMDITRPQNLAIPIVFIAQDSVGGLLISNQEKTFEKFLVFDSSIIADNIEIRLRRNPFYSDHAKSKAREYEIFIRDPAQVVLDYMENLSVDPVSKVATVINLEVKDRNAKRGVSFLQALIDIYNYQNLQDKNRVTYKTIDFLNLRLINVARELQSVEDTVEKLKTLNKVVELSTDAQQYLTAAQVVDEEKAKSQTQYNIVLALEETLKENQTGPRLVPSTLGINEPSLISLIETYNQLVLLYERQKRTSGENHPLVINTRQQIQEIRNSLIANVQNLKKAFSISLTDISRKDEELNSRIRKVPILEKKLVEITRNQNVQQHLYAFLLQKREEAAITGASNVVDSRVILYPRYIEVISPKKALTFVLAVVLGFILPISIVGVRDFFNNKIGNLEEIQNSTAVPMIGEIGYVRKAISPLVIHEKSRTVVAEQLRNIRTAVTFTGKGKKLKKILISSFQPGDGKSFVSLNLAASFALLRKRTVILEFDLRRPQISKSFNYQTDVGISSFLSGKVGLDDILYPIPNYNDSLFLVPAGYLPPNPAELIAGVYMEKLIEALEREFDYIIIDTPPINMVSDANLLQQFSDLTIIVLRQSVTSKSVFDQLNRMETVHSQPTYLLLNGTGRKRRYKTEGSYTYYSKEYFSEVD